MAQRHGASAGFPPPQPERRSNPLRVRRTISAPAAPSESRGPWQIIKGIMKLKTLDESLHSKYGSDSSVASNSKKVNIQFKNIEIREFARTVGDNPSVSSGPPITISWEYNPNTTVLSIEEYEKCRPTRRTQSQMILPRSLRMQMLRKEWGVSQSQIAQAVRQGIRTKSQRRTTLGNLGKTEKVEEMIEGATKQLLKSLFLRKSSSKQAQELGDTIQKVKQQRSQLILEHVTEGEYSESSYSTSPWAIDLLPDESGSGGSGSEWQESHDSLLDSPIVEQHASIDISLNSRMSQTSDSSSRKDDAPKKPVRPEPSDSSVGDLSSSSDEDEVQPIFLNKQSTGESAIQHDGTAQRFPKPAMITATEPDDEKPPIVPSPPRIEVDC